MTEIISTIISALGLIGVALIGMQSNKYQKNNQKYRKERSIAEEIHAQENYLQMKMQSATLDLAYVTSLAVTGGHTNGNVKEAQRKAERAKKEYYEFINKTYASETVKL